MNEHLINLGIKAGDIILKNTTETIFNRIDVAKADSNKDKTIIKLEEVITELIDDRNELNKIVKEYDEALSMQKISERDVSYITNNLLPIINELIQSDLVQDNPNINSQEMEYLIDILKPILSIETFTILQLLGFNFREALGEPLTKTVSKIINSKNSPRENFEYHQSANKKEEELYKLLQTEEGRLIYKKILSID